MQYYSEFIEIQTNRNLGFVKVMNSYVNNKALTVVTTNGNYFFRRGRDGCAEERYRLRLREADMKQYVVLPLHE